VAGDDDDGQFVRSGREFLLQLEAGHIRHSDVEQQASPPRRVIGVEKFLAGGVGLDAQALGLEQGFQGFPDRVVVVDDENGSFIRHYLRLHRVPEAM